MSGQTGNRQPLPGCSTFLVRNFCVIFVVYVVIMTHVHQPVAANSNCRQNLRQNLVGTSVATVADSLHSSTRKHFSDTLPGRCAKAA